MDNKLFKFSGEFLSSNKEISFRNENWKSYSKYLFQFSFFLTLFFVSLDIKNILLFNFTKNFIILISLKGLLVLSLIILSINCFLKSKIDKLFIAYSFFIFITFLNLSAENTLKNNFFSQNSFYILILLILSFFTFFNLSSYWILVSSLISSIIYLSSIYLFEKPDIFELINSGLLLLAINTIGFYISRRISYIERGAFQNIRKQTELLSELDKERKKISELEKKFVKAEKIKEQKPLLDKFSDVLNQEFNRSIRYDSDISIITMEIDYIEMFKETLGEKAVKALIINVIKICELEIRPVGDFFSRTGTNEFTFILPSTDEYGAFSLAERIRERVKKVSYKIDGKKIKISLSIGIASINQEKDPKELLENSKSALKSAINSGRDQSVFYSLN